MSTTYPLPADLADRVFLTFGAAEAIREYRPRRAVLESAIRQAESEADLFGEPRRLYSYHVEEAYQDARDNAHRRKAAYRRAVSLRLVSICA